MTKASVIPSGAQALLGFQSVVMTRALDRLGMLGLARRKRDEADKRNVLVQRTVKGSVFLTEFSEIMVSTAKGAK